MEDGEKITPKWKSVKKREKKGSCEPTYKHTKQKKTVRNERLTDSDADQDVSPLSEDDVHV